jgi:hypothetical protein
MSWGNDPSCGSEAMKPGCHCSIGRKRFPQTDYFFHSGSGGWRGHSSSYDGEDGWEFRTFYNLSREFMIESARERVKEMVVFGVVVVASAWPVIYMVVTVVKLLSKGRP